MGLPLPDEHTQFERIGEENRRHRVQKPLSDTGRGLLLMETGAVMELVPNPPTRVLECGCGTGWLAYFLAKSGFDVVG